MKTATRWFLILLLLVAVVAWNYAMADPSLIFRGKDNKEQNISILLYQEQCALPGEMLKSLEYRTTYHEPGKTYEGCFTVTVIPSPSGETFPVILIYWDDKTFTVIPLFMFARDESI